jgi:hypothetical protein
MSSNSGWKYEVVDRSAGFARQYRYQYGLWRPTVPGMFYGERNEAGRLAQAMSSVSRARRLSDLKAEDERDPLP